MGPSLSPPLLYNINKSSTMPLKKLPLKILFILWQVHRLHLCTAELLATVLADALDPPQSCVFSHPWASPNERRVSIRERVRDVWEQHFGVSQKSTGHSGAATLLQELKSVDSPAATPNVPLRQVPSTQSIVRPSCSVFTSVLTKRSVMICL